MSIQTISSLLSTSTATGLIVGVIVLLVKYLLKLIVYLYMMRTQPMLGGGVLVLLRTNASTYLVVCKPDWKREWEEFGGRADEGETGEDAREREFTEEAGEWLRSAGLLTYHNVGEWTMGMKVNAGRTYRSSISCVMMSQIVEEESLRAWSSRKYQDRGYLAVREISIDFLPVQDISHKHGIVYQGKSHEIKLSARLRRVLKDRRVRESIDRAANATWMDSSSDEGIIVSVGPYTEVISAVNAN
jgi:hypothetical protein